MTDHIKIMGGAPRIRYVADGTNKTFQFPFAIFNDENIAVYINDVLQTSRVYSVSISEQSTGGSVTFQSAPPTQSIITLTRNLSIERTTDFQEGHLLRAKALNDELDYQTACMQQLADNLNRSMVLPPYAIGNDVNLTLPLPNAGKAIVWNADGTNLENSTVDVNALESTIRSYKDTAQNAADTAVSTLNDKMNKDMSNSTKPYIVETYVNGNGWYRLWSDKWCEQGGTVTLSTNATTVNFYKPFANTNYNVHLTEASGSVAGLNMIGVIAKTQSSFDAVINSGSGGGNYWSARGITA